METKQSKGSILLLPWLGHGHISPFFELAKKLSNKGFHIYFCSTAVNLQSLRKNQKSLRYSSQYDISSIEFVDIQLPSSFQELPPHYHTTKDLPPHLKNTLIEAFDAAKPAFGEILKTLKPDFVIYDLFQPWAPDAAREQNIEAIMFLTCGGANCAFVAHYIVNPTKEFPFAEFRIPDKERMEVSRFMLDKVNGITHMQRFNICIKKSYKLVLIKTSVEIEEKYNDYLSQLAELEMVPVGPLVQKPEEKDDDAKIMEWLDKKEPDSVVFVSFGSEYFLSNEEIEEMAYGLELSNVNFIWVLRFHGGQKTTIEEALPQGFLERIGDKGLIVENWAPQAKILAHKSTGGFVSHCGWNSTLEGMYYGVPIIAIPMQLDQPLNAKLVMQIGVGIGVPRKNKKLVRDEVGRVIKRVVVQEEGKEVRKKAKELGQKLQDKGDKEMDMAVDKVLLLVNETKH